MNPVMHFEIQADDIERAKKFYENALGWKITKMMSKEEGGMDYWGVETRDKETGHGINGGMYQRTEAGDDKNYLFDCTIAVKDIDAVMGAIKSSGGEIVREKSLLKGVGWLAAARDPEGNRFGLIQPTEWKPA